MKKASLFLTIILIAFAALSCAYDSREGDKDIEEQQAMFLTLTAPADLYGACTSAEDAALSCLTPIGAAAAYTAILEAAYKITISAPQGSPEICSVLPYSPYYPNPANKPGSPNYMTYTDQAKICLFGCGKEYWKSMNAAGNCTNTNYPLALTDPAHPLYMASNPAYKTCIENCFIRGTILPPF